MRRKTSFEISRVGYGAGMVRSLRFGKPKRHRKVIWSTSLQIQSNEKRKREGTYAPQPPSTQKGIKLARFQVHILPLGSRVKPNVPFVFHRMSTVMSSGCFPVIIYFIKVRARSLLILTYPHALISLAEIDGWLIQRKKLVSHDGLCVECR